MGFVLAGLLLVIGIYMVVISIAPALTPLPSSTTPVIVAPKSQENRLYIPKIGVDIALIQGEAEALEKGAWHRWPERGDPQKGGNFIISAHRFALGFTPGETIHKSPFYHIDKLHLGDRLYVDFKGQRYTYQISERFSVKPTQTSIEDPSDTPKLTLYSCTLRGERDGRDVLVAHLVQ